jgi:hypothetical protein
MIPQTTNRQLQPVDIGSAEPDQTLHYDQIALLPAAQHVTEAPRANYTPGIGFCCTSDKIMHMLRVCMKVTLPRVCLKTNIF